MRSLNFYLVICFTAAALVGAQNTFGLGSSWIIGSGSSSSIRKVSTTFTPGPPPVNQSGELILYSGLSNGTGDLLRTSVESWANQSGCGATNEQWCIRTMVFSNGKQINGQLVPLDPDQSVTFTFERYQNDSGWTQSAAVNGTTVSQLDYASGPMSIFGMTTECDDACVMTISPQTYSNTTIYLDEPNETWNETSVVGSSIYGTDLSGQQSTSVEGISNNEDGSVWDIATITIPAFGSSGSD